MTKAKEVDLHEAIKALAEAEWGCPDAREFGIEHCKADLGSGLYSHTLCGGTGRFVPFAALRAPCPQSNHHSCMELSGGCPICHNRAWVPEPDLEKACWRIWKQLPQLPFGVILHLPTADTWEEAVIGKALAWLEEQHV